MAAISRIRCRANEEGLARPTAGVINSEFSGCVGSRFKARGLDRLGFVALAVAGGLVVGSGSSGCEAVDEGAGGVSECSDTSAVVSSAGRRLNFPSFRETKGEEVGRVGDVEVRKSRLPQSLILVLSVDSSDKSSKSTRSRSRRKARSRRTMPFVILGL